MKNLFNKQLFILLLFIIILTILLNLNKTEQFRLYYYTKSNIPAGLKNSDGSTKPIETNISRLWNIVSDKNNNDNIEYNKYIKKYKKHKIFPMYDEDELTTWGHTWNKCEEKPAPKWSKFKIKEYQ